jgi:hypothetical protein
MIPDPPPFRSNMINLIFDNLRGGFTLEPFLGSGIIQPPQNFLPHLGSKIKNVKGGVYKKYIRPCYVISHNLMQILTGFLRFWLFSYVFWCG